MKIFGIIAIVTTGWFSTGLFLMWAMQAVHNWWPLVPGMSYAVALKITFFLAASGVVNGILKAILEDDK